MIKKSIQAILYIGDVFLFIMAPMFIILIIVCVIAFLDRYGQHNRFVELFEAHGKVTQVILDGPPNPELGYHIEFISEDGENLYGFLDPKYYSPGVTQQLTEDAQVNILYLPPPYNYENDVVLAEHFSEVQNYLGYAHDLGGIFIVSWLIVALHPEWLYWGFVKDFGDIVKKTWDKSPPWLNENVS